MGFIVLQLLWLEFLRLRPIHMNEEAFVSCRAKVSLNVATAAPGWRKSSSEAIWLRRQLNGAKLNQKKSTWSVPHKNHTCVSENNPSFLQIGNFSNSLQWVFMAAEKYLDHHYIYTIYCTVKTSSRVHAQRRFLGSAQTFLFRVQHAGGKRRERVKENKRRSQKEKVKNIKKSGWGKRGKEKKVMWGGNGERRTVRGEVRGRQRITSREEEKERGRREVEGREWAEGEREEEKEEEVFWSAATKWDV